ncbi:MAG: hydrogenase maturation nickel metallochaperone HypA [Gammaproteobacteria bacterium]
MHELSVCNALMTQVESIAAQNFAGRVARIELEVGPLSGVEPDLLRRAYPLAIAGTVAADAALVIDVPDVVVRCTQCETESAVPTNRLLCDRCGDFRTQIVSGEELILKRLELEDIATPA